MSLRRATDTLVGYLHRYPVRIAATCLALTAGGAMLLPLPWWDGALATATVIAVSIIAMLVVNTTRNYPKQLLFVAVLSHLGLLTRLVELNFVPGSSGLIGYAILTAGQISAIVFLPAITGMSSGKAGFQPLIAAEGITMGFAWVLMSWRVLVGGADIQTLHHHMWPMLILIIAIGSMLSAMALTMIRRITLPGMLFYATGVSWISGELAINSRFGGLSDQGADMMAALYFTAFLFSVCASSVSFVGGADIQPDVDVPDRWRAFVSTGSVLLALGLVGWDAARRPQLDPTFYVLLAGVVLAFFMRAYFRTRYQHELVTTCSGQAYTDALTGVGNRRKAVRDLEAAPPDGPGMNVSILDISGFRRINDSYGQAMGDRVLAAIGQAFLRLDQQRNSSYYRLGGNEFAVLTPGTSTHGYNMARLAAGDIRDTIADMCPGWSGVVRVGIASCEPGHHSSVDAPEGQGHLLADATDALATAKSSDQHLVAYHPALRAAIHRRGIVETHLRRAIETGLIAVRFEPVGQSDGTLKPVVEAVLSWHDPDLGVVEPSEFLPVAETTGLMRHLGAIVVAESTKLMATLRDVNSEAQVSFNATPSQLAEPLFVEMLTSAAAQHRVPHSSISVEITEAVFLAEDPQVLTCVYELANSGFRITLDDFGNGYTSLSNLGTLPLDTIKLDSGVTHSLGDPAIRTIVRALVRNLQAQDRHLVPTGVSDAAEALALSELGASWIQGPAVAQPLTAAELVATLRSRVIST